MPQSFNEYDPIKVVGVRRAQEAFVHQVKIDGEWKDLRFKSPPGWDEAVYEHRGLVDVLRHSGAMVQSLPAHPNLTLDSIYTRDATIVTPKGLILCNMGRLSRTAEPRVNIKSYLEIGFSILGEIESPGTLEGGDFVWFSKNKAAVGLGPRTNKEGITQLKALLGEDVDLHIVPLPEPENPENVFHLMSIISPLDKDLALVYKPLINNEFSEYLLKQNIGLIDVDEEEYLNMACNVLTLSPRKILMLDSLPKTKQKLEDNNCDVITFKGDEISRKGEGGPTCLTRPLERKVV